MLSDSGKAILSQRFLQSHKRLYLQPLLLLYSDACQGPVSDVQQQPWVPQVRTLRGEENNKCF